MSTEKYFVGYRNSGNGFKSRNHKGYKARSLGFVYTKGDNSITKKEQDTLLRYIENTDVHKKECS